MTHIFRAQNIFHYFNGTKCYTQFQGAKCSSQFQGAKCSTQFQRAKCEACSNERKHNRTSQNVSTHHLYITMSLSPLDIFHVIVPELFQNIPAAPNATPLPPLAPLHPPPPLQVWFQEHSGGTKCLSSLPSLNPYGVSSRPLGTPSGTIPELGMFWKAFWESKPAPGFHFGRALGNPFWSLESFRDAGMFWRKSGGGCEVYICYSIVM